MSYRIIFHKKAEEEYNNGYVWYETEKLGLDERFEKEIEKILSHIITNPETYSINKNSFREAHTNVFPYAIVYKCK